MQLLTNAVGRKVLMAVTGIFMVLFIVVHLLGNSSIFVGPDGINAYAAKLHSLGPVVWVFRAVMLALLLVHVWFGVTLTLENSAANPAKYAVSRKLKATFSSETMIWTGLLLLAFIVWHLLQFTVRVTPDIVKGVDAQGRYDVFTMVLTSFQHTWIALMYVAFMIVLFLHLKHGIQSFFQTLGLSNEKTLPSYGALGMVLSVIFLVGYCSIPVTILAGILPK